LASISKRSSPLGMIAGPTGPSPRRGHSHRAPRPLERRICPSPIGGLRGHTGQSVDARRTFGLSWIKTNCLKWNWSICWVSDSSGYTFSSLRSRSVACTGNLRVR
jgi:hypothetical protein